MASPTSPAFLRSANREAAVWFERALTALQHLPRDRAAIEQAIDLRIDLRHALFQVGEFRRVHDYLAEAEELARTLGDQRREGQVASYLASYFNITGDPARTVEFGHQALALAAAIGDPAIEVTTNFYLGIAFYALGDYRRGIAVCRRNVEVLDRTPIGEHYFVQAPLISSLTRSAWARSLAELGEFEEAATCADESLRLAEASERPFHVINATFARGIVGLLRGDLDHAILSLERGLDLCRTAKILLLLPGCGAALGHAYMLSRRLGEALELLEHVVGQAASTQQTGSSSRRVAYLGEAYLTAGRSEDAARLAEQARTLARDHKERGHEAYVLRLLGEIATHADPLDAPIVEDHYRKALALADELGMRPLVAHCHLGLGRLHRRMGKRQEAQDHLGTAISMYGEMDMRFWLPQAEAELKA